MKNRQLFFKLLSLSFPVILLFFVESALRLTGTGTDLSVFIDFNEKYYQLNPTIGRKYFSQLKRPPTPNFQLMKKNKSPITRRIFVFGGSSAAGYPYYNNITFPNFSRRILEERYPEFFWEVVNFSMAAVNSFTVVDLLDESVEYSPDLVLIYMGHNEFYGAGGLGASGPSLGVGGPFLLFLRKLYFFQFLEDFFAKGSSSKDNTLMRRMIGKQVIENGSDVYEQTLKNFENNLLKIIKTCEKNKIPFCLSTIVSNEKDHYPFVCHPPLDSISKPDFLNDGPWSKMAPLLNKYPHHSGLRYSYGRYLLKEDSLKKAKGMFRFAVDHDLLKFRAPQEINEIIKKVSKTSSFVKLVDSYHVFSSKSQGGIIGNEFLCDHLHFNMEGYKILGEIFVKGAREALSLNEQCEMGRNLDFRFSPLDSTLGRIRLSVLTSQYPYNENHEKIKFTMTGYVDTLAWDVYSNRLTWEAGHYHYIRKLERSNEILPSICEYEALLTALPYQNSSALMIARLYEEQEDWKKAEDYRLKALKIDSDFQALLSTGDFYLRKRRLGEAFRYLRRAEKINPCSKKLLKSLAQAHYEAGNRKKAKEIINKIR